MGVVRLRRPQDFRRVWSNGRSWAHPLFVLYRLPNELAEFRIGITASRKVGNAVARNRSRRLLREAVRMLSDQISDGWDIVLVARSALLGVKEQEVEAALSQMLRRARLDVKPEA